jgi:hypothetical protein
LTLTLLVFWDDVALEVFEAGELATDPGRAE